LQASLTTYPYPVTVATTHVLSGAKRTVGIDDVFANELEDVIVDFRGKGVPVRHWRVVLKDVRGRWTQRVSCSSASLINQTNVRDSSCRQSHWMVDVTLGGIQWTRFSLNAYIESLGLFASWRALIIRKSEKGAEEGHFLFFRNAHGPPPRCE